MRPNPVLKKLGLADDDRAVIIHVDDIGMCHATIEAYADLYEFGMISSGAVMVPCPWFLEAAKFARIHPGADLGVHLTLNSEWTNYRWGPLSTRDPQSGLLDEEGYLHLLAAQTQEHARPEAVAREIEAQMQHALAAGIKPTHADTHMGALAHLKFVQDYVQLALKYNVPPMIFRMDEEGWRRVAGEHKGAALDEEAIATVIQMTHTLEEMGLPLLDDIVQLPLDGDPDIRLEQTKQKLENLKPGITHFIIHPAKDTPELRAIAPEWGCRIADYETFLKPELRETIQDLGLHVIGYRAIQDIMGD